MKMAIMLRWAVAVITIPIMGYILCASQAYISMYEYKDDKSSTCMDCSYIEEILTDGFLFYLPFLFFYFLFCFFVRNRHIKNIYKTVPIMQVFIIVCFMLDRDIFISRETSWSTYTKTEELAGTIYESGFAIMIATTVFYCLISYFNMIRKRFVSKTNNH